MLTRIGVVEPLHVAGPDCVVGVRVRLCGNSPVQPDEGHICAMLENGFAGLHRRFFAAAARVIDTPWQVAVGSDPAKPGVQGRRTVAGSIVSRNLLRLFHAAQYDATVALAFIRVVHMIAEPASLFTLAIAARVLRHNLRRRPTPVPQLRPDVDATTLLRAPSGW